MKRWLTLMLLFFAFSIFAQVQIAEWTFESSLPTNSGPHDAESGSGQAYGYHTSSSTAYSSPVGNGSGHSFSSNRWEIGDYYEFISSTTGLEKISVGWDQTGSNTGPKDFSFQYSVDGGASYTTVLSYQLTNDSWSSVGGRKSVSTRFVDLSSYSDLNDVSIVYFRLICITNNSINNGSIAVDGSSRVDNFSIVAAQTLPILLNSFNLDNSNHRTQITFSTSLEINNSHFIIEWSPDARSWKAIGSIEGSGTSTISHQYKYLHESPKSGINYYRLTQVDYDGKYQTFPVKSIHFEAEAHDFTISPSLVEHDMELGFNQAVDQGQVEIYSMEGRLVANYQISNGVNSLRINASNLQRGQYIARFSNDYETINKKFIKF
ncbi:MAG: T9SS type A sorting domain-containing protein [Chitinophagales bacterium]|nr:T9SS type A sorting domain-containing protein [Chitinophagales bacterium]